MRNEEWGRGNGEWRIVDGRWAIVHVARRTLDKQLTTDNRPALKTYHDIARDGGSDVIGQVAAQRRQMADRLASVRHVVAVMSGKGGVGKSAVTVNLAAALAAGGAAVGILDADLNGPSVARMTGVRDAPPRAGPSGVDPPVAAGGLQVMSIDLFLPSDDTPVLWEAPTQQDAYAWRGLMEAAALRELLADTAWGALDVLLVDLPPGAERLPNLIDVAGDISGVIVVTIPSELSQGIVAKAITAARLLSTVPLLGLVENMASYICPHCGEEERLFPAEAVAALAVRMGVPYLGAIPFDPPLAAAADAGQPYVVRHPDRPAARALRDLAAALLRRLDDDPERGAP